ncbi:Type I transmembrane sorting receptor [Ascosphaera pollenicola]|nr:Type I transmembrane sorting receptor [Ascosphaera pollenicola]
MWTKWGLPAISIISGILGHTSSHTPSDSRAVTFSSGSKSASVKVDIVEERVLVPLSVNGQEFKVLLDTGSTISWMYTQRTPKSTRQKNAHYNLQQHDLVSSSSFFQLYGGMSWAGGDVFQADVKLGDMTIENQALGSGDITYWPPEEMSGLLGLAFPYWNTVIGPNNDSVLQRVTANLDEPLFTTSFKKSGDSYVDFGYVDRKKYSGNITYITADASTGWWGLQLNASYADASSHGMAIIDTGSPTLSLNADIVDAYYEKVFTYDSRPGQRRVRCNDILPDITLNLDGYEMTIGGEALKFREGKNNCTCLLEAEAIPGMSILGLPFYKTRFIVHRPELDGVPRLGFAEHA